MKRIWKFVSRIRTPFRSTIPQFSRHDKERVEREIDMMKSRLKVILEESIKDNDTKLYAAKKELEAALSNLKKQINETKAPTSNPSQTIALPPNAVDQFRDQSLENTLSNLPLQGENRIDITHAGHLKKPNPPSLDYNNMNNQKEEFKFDPNSLKEYKQNNASIITKNKSNDDFRKENQTTTINPVSYSTQKISERLKKIILLMKGERLVENINKDLTKKTQANAAEIRDKTQETNEVRLPAFIEEKRRLDAGLVEGNKNEKLWTENANILPHKQQTRKSTEERVAQIILAKKKKAEEQIKNTSTSKYLDIHIFSGELSPYLSGGYINHQNNEKTMNETKSSKLEKEVSKMESVQELKSIERGSNTGPKDFVQANNSEAALVSKKLSPYSDSKANLAFETKLSPQKEDAEKSNLENDKKSGYSQDSQTATFSGKIPYRRPGLKKNSKKINYRTSKTTKDRRHEPNSSQSKVTHKNEDSNIKKTVKSTMANKHEKKEQIMDTTSTRYAEEPYRKVVQLKESNFFRTAPKKPELKKTNNVDTHTNNDARKNKNPKHSDSEVQMCDSTTLKERTNTIKAPDDSNIVLESQELPILKKTKKLEKAPQIDSKEVNLRNNNETQTNNDARENKNTKHSDPETQMRDSTTLKKRIKQESVNTIKAPDDSNIVLESQELPILKKSKKLEKAPLIDSKEINLRNNNETQTSYDARQNKNPKHRNDETHLRGSTPLRGRTKQATVSSINTSKKPSIVFKSQEIPILKKSKKLEKAPQIDWKDDQ